MPEQKESPIDADAIDIDDKAAEFVEYEDNIKDNESVYSDTPPSISSVTLGQTSRSSFAFSPSGPKTDAATSSSSASFTSSATASTSVHTKYVTDPALKVQGTLFSAIGKQIKLVEAEIKATEEQATKEFKTLIKPSLQQLITAMERRVAELRVQLTKVSNENVSLQYLSKLEDEMNQLNEKLDEKKKLLYLRTSEIKLGQAGVYLGLNDLWLEHASGHFSLDLIPDESLPSIDLKLSGSEGNKTSGLMLKLKAQDFKLVGDKGKGVPKINFDKLKITVGLSAHLRLSYDIDRGKWRASQFKISILSFKGPYGLNRRYVCI